MSREQLIACLDGQYQDAKANPFDRMRNGYMAFLLKNWTAVGGQLTCPAKSKDPRSCYNCLDQQITLCLNDNARYQDRIYSLSWNEPEQPFPLGDELMTMNNPTVTVDVDSLPLDREALLEMKDYKLRTALAKLGLNTTEETRTAFRQASKEMLVDAILEKLKAVRSATRDGVPVQVSVEVSPPYKTPATAAASAPILPPAPPPAPTSEPAQEASEVTPVYPPSIPAPAPSITPVYEQNPSELAALKEELHRLETRFEAQSHVLEHLQAMLSQVWVMTLRSQYETTLQELGVDPAATAESKNKLFVETLNKRTQNWTNKLMPQFSSSPETAPKRGRPRKTEPEGKA